jgi:hypothetical protein
MDDERREEKHLLEHEWLIGELNRFFPDNFDEKGEKDGKSKEFVETTRRK